MYINNWYEMLPNYFKFVSIRELKLAKYSPENSVTKWGQSLQLHNVKSHLIAQFDNFNAHTSV